MEKLKKKLNELEQQKVEIEATFHQISGAIKFAKQLIEEEESDVKKEDSKKQHDTWKGYISYKEHMKQHKSQ